MSWGLVAVGVGTVAGSIISSEGSKDAAETGALAAGQASDTELQKFRESMALQEPWQQSGEGALNYLSNYLGIGGARTLPKPTEEQFTSYTPGFEKVDKDQFTRDWAKKQGLQGPSTWDARAWKNLGSDIEDAWGQYNKEWEDARTGTLDEQAYQNALSQWGQQNQQFQEQYGSFGGLSPESYEQSPYYNFLMDEGVNALTNQASGRGRVLSGSQGEALQEYGQNLASTDYGNWLNRKYQSLAPYQSLAGAGQNTATVMGQQSIGTGTSLANNALYAGNLQAQNEINQANIWGNAVTGLGNLGTNYLMNRPQTTTTTTPLSGNYPYGPV